ncbi:MAG: hypothetical protein ACFE9S_00785 [Candidatus Hermodarchaeota archaeon]
MNEVIYSLLIILMLLRFIGLIVCAEYYFNTKKKIFLIMSIAWLLWIFAVIFAIFSDLSEIILFLNVVFASLSSILMMLGLVFYFLEFPLKIVFLLIFIEVFVSIVLYLFFGLLLSLSFSNLINYIAIFGAYLIPLINRKRFKEVLGKATRWYYSLIIIGVLFIPFSLYFASKGYSFGLYDSNNIIDIIINYSIAYLTTFLILIMIMNVENVISTREKFVLKDEYSHSLGNIMQALYSITDIMDNNELDDKKLQNLKKLHKEKLNEARKLIKEIRKL